MVDAASTFQVDCMGVYVAQTNNVESRSEASLCVHNKPRSPLTPCGKSFKFDGDKAALALKKGRLIFPGNFSLKPPRTFAAGILNSGGFLPQKH